MSNDEDMREPYQYDDWDDYDAYCDDYYDDDDYDDDYDQDDFERYFEQVKPHGLTLVKIVVSNLFFAVRYRIDRKFRERMDDIPF